MATDKELQKVQRYLRSIPVIGCTYQDACDDIDAGYYDWMLGPRPAKPQWHRWFAWHPVLTPDGLRWLCWLERRWSSGREDRLSMEYSAWEYRRPS